MQLQSTTIDQINIEMYSLLSLEKMFATNKITAMLWIMGANESIGLGRKLKTGNIPILIHSYCL